MHGDTKNNQDHVRLSPSVLSTVLRDFKALRHFNFAKLRYYIVVFLYTADLWVCAWIATGGQ